jgi:hypothetical protein
MPQESTASRVVHALPPSWLAPYGQEDAYKDTRDLWRKRGDKGSRCAETYTRVTANRYALAVAMTSMSVKAATIPGTWSFCPRFA